MQRTVLTLILLLLSTSAFAATGTGYISAPEELLSGGGTAEGISYITDSAIGGEITGVASSAAYSTSFGFLGLIATYALSEADTPTTLTNKVYNYPNPFNPNSGPTAIAYNLSAAANVTVYIFNNLGQLIWKRDFAAGTTGGESGYNEISWDGRANSGSLAANDIYFVALVADGQILGRGKLAVIK